MSKDAVKKTVKLYGDSVTIHFNSNARNRYTIAETGESPVGVTTILSSLSKGEGLMLWPLWEGVEWLKTHKDDYEGALKAHTLKSDRGKDVGSITHGLIEQLLKNDIKASEYGKDLFSDPAVLKAFTAFQGWYIKNEPKVLGTEQIIYSKKYNYAGTYDALLEIDGEVILVDIKTTNVSRTAPIGIYPEMFLQLGAYVAAHLEENPLEKIDDAMIIRVGKDGQLNVLKASDLDLDLLELAKTFNNLVQVYKFMLPLKIELSEYKGEKSAKD